VIDTPMPLETTGAVTGLRFKLDRLIGRGSFGLVYRAVQLGLNRPVALKLLHPDALSSTEQVGRFLNEARVTASLKHPHIVEVIDHGVAGEQPWIAYEYLPGPTLRALLLPHGFEWLRAAEIGTQVGDALDEAHRQAVIHRDVKPENVMEAEGGRFKVTDFGLAKWNHRAAFRTASASCLGTPAYLAPELIATGKASPFTDQYALGALVYELLTGQVPFAGDTAAAVVERHLKSAPPPPSALRPGVPRAVDRAVLTALAKNPRERHRSVADFARELQRIADRSTTEIELTSADPPPSASRSSIRHFQTRGILLALAFGVALATVSLDPLRLRPHPGPPVDVTLPVPSVADILARSDARAGRTKELAGYVNPLFLRLSDAAPIAASLETEIRADQRTLTVLRERVLAYYPEPDRVPPAEATLVARLLVNAARGWCWLENMSNTREAIDGGLAAHGDQSHGAAVIAEMQERSYSAGGDAFLIESARMVRASFLKIEAQPALISPEVASLISELYWLGSVSGFRSWPAEAQVRLREVPRLLAPKPGSALSDVAAAVWELGHARMNGVKAAREGAHQALARLAASGLPHAVEITAALERELSTSARPAARAQ